MTETLTNSGVYHLDRNAYVLGGEPMIFHCHHYNVFLQRSIEETKKYIEVYPILVDSAHEVVYTQFQELFEGSETNIEERKKIVEECYRVHGFGKIDLGNVNQSGGAVETANEHYSHGWKIKFGNRKKDEPGVSFFTRGYLAGALEAIYGLEFGTVQTAQTKCLTKGDDICRFEISKREEKAELSLSPGEGKYQTFSRLPEHENINYTGIREALIGMPIQGSEKNGLIDAFGVFLTRHYANYYNLIGLRTMLTMEHEFGEAGVSIVKELLTEAGHVCAFNTMGGIMLSPEWNALIKPMIKTRDDWAHGIIACTNALGWGLWEIDEIDPEGESKFKVIGGYESNAYVKALGNNKSKYTMSCLVTGGVAGIMNLIYHGDITQAPSLDDKYYNKIFKTKGRFASKQVEDRAMGSEIDSFIVARSF